MKICIVRNDRMGDMILTFPIIKGIKEKNANSVIHVIGSQKNIKICKNFSYIDQFFLKSSSLKTFINLVNSSKLQNYDYYFNFSPGWFGLILGVLIKSKVKSSLLLKSRYRSNIFSKYWQTQLTKLFFSYSKNVNRFMMLKKGINIHQTSMMLSLVNKSKLPINNKVDLNFTFSSISQINKKKPICVIHLSYKWINKYYSEQDFIELLTLLSQKEILIYLTSDETTMLKFFIIFRKYSIVKNSDQLRNKNEQIIICKDFNFESWSGLINQAKYTITPECGCTHIASLTKTKLSVIYDSDNSPRSIMNEYAPWNKKYLALQTNDSELNTKLLDFI